MKLSINTDFVVLAWLNWKYRFDMQIVIEIGMVE